MCIVSLAFTPLALHHHRSRSHAKCITLQSTINNQQPTFTKNTNNTTVHYRPVSQCSLSASFFLQVPSSTYASRSIVSAFGPCRGLKVPGVFNRIGLVSLVSSIISVSCLTFIPSVLCNHLHISSLSSLRLYIPLLPRGSACRPQLPHPSISLFYFILSPTSLEVVDKLSPAGYSYSLSPHHGPLPPVFILSFSTHYIVHSTLLFLLHTFFLFFIVHYHFSLHTIVSVSTNSACRTIQGLKDTICQSTYLRSSCTLMGRH